MSKPFLRRCRRTKTECFHLGLSKQAIHHLERSCLAATGRTEGELECLRGSLQPVNLSFSLKTKVLKALMQRLVSIKSKRSGFVKRTPRRARAFFLAKRTEASIFEVSWNIFYICTDQISRCLKQNMKAYISVIY